MKSILKSIIDEYKYFTSKNWALREVGVFWDSVSDYDDINEKTYTYFRRFTDGFKVSTIPDNSYVLEVMPRTGNGALYFYEKGKISKVVGADVSQFQADIFMKNMGQEGIDFKSVMLKDYSFPFEDGEFEAVLSFETVEHMGQPKKFIAEIGRVDRAQIDQYYKALNCRRILDEQYLLIDGDYAFDPAHTWFQDLYAPRSDARYVTLQYFSSVLAPSNVTAYRTANNNFLYGEGNDGNTPPGEEPMGAIGCIDELFNNGIEKVHFTSIPTCVTARAFAVPVAPVLDHYCMPELGKITVPEELL